MLARNTIANFLGQGWAALMSVVFVPLYVQYLGMEAFGIIGFFVALQAWLVVLDLGVTPILNREMARYRSGQHSADGIKSLLRTTEALVLLVAVALAVAFVLMAPLVVRQWLQLETLEERVVIDVIRLVGVVSALRLVEALYRAALLGLEHQVQFNVLVAVVGTMRAVGVLALFAAGYATLGHFFQWQVVVSVLSVMVLAVATYRALPPSTGRVSISTIAPLRRLVAGMIAITVLSVLLMNVDKLLLSGLLSLTAYGEYSLATAVASGLFLVVTPIAQAWYPRMSGLHAAGDEVGLQGMFHTGARLVSVLAGGAAILLMAFAELLLAVWTGDASLASRVAPLVALLVLGNLLNCLMWLPYHAQLAHGWTALTVRLNTAAVLVIVPALLLVTPRFGAVGAATVWVGLNAFYVLVGARLMFRRILVGAQSAWYRHDLARVLGVGALVGGGLATLLPAVDGAADRVAGAIRLAFIGIAIVAPMAFAAGLLPRPFAARAP